jgi:mannose-6-phosphate isomerase-like protein (cupin superfamily)
VKTTSKVQVLICAAALSAFALVPSATFFDNDEVKVLRALEKVHVKGSFHEHKSNRVMIYLQSGKQHFEYKDGRAAENFDWKAGQAVWSKADGFHSPEVISDEPFNIVEVKKPGKPGAGASTALKVDPKHYKLEFENDQVRVLRAKLGPHESSKKVERTGNSVTVFMSGKKAGEAVWETAGATQAQNGGDEPLEMIVVELKD